MSTLTTILTRTSYRGKYDPTPIPREHLRQLLEAGYAAPSGCNKQTTSFIAVDDPDLAPENWTSYNVRKKRKKTNKGAERRWQERTSQSSRSSSSYGK